MQNFGYQHDPKLLKLYDQYGVEGIRNFIEEHFDDPRFEDLRADIHQQLPALIVWLRK